MKDNYDFYVEHEREQERWLASRPICACCGEHIQSEYMWEIEPGEWYCEVCKDEWLLDHMSEVEDYE